MLVRLGNVPEADHEGFLTVMRNEMPCLHDSVLAPFATVDSPLAILLGNGEHAMGPMRASKTCRPMGQPTPPSPLLFELQTPVLPTNPPSPPSPLHSVCMHTET